ncbi:MAG: glycosyl transferase [Micrococcales bacterium]|nr:MAG: glycosyl transferase [Micrococcales bacterium]
MKVLLVHGSSTGGVGRHVAEVAAGIARAGHTVIVAAPPDAADRLAVIGATHPHPGPHGEPGFVPVDIADRPRGAADAKAVATLRRLVRGADVAHAHGLRAGAVTALALSSTRDGAIRKRSRGVRFVVTLHNLPMGDPRTRTIAAGLLTLVDAASTAGARQVATALVPAPVADPPDLDEVWRVRSELLSYAEDPTGDVVVLVTVARLARQKGLERLIEATALLRRQLASDGRAVICVIAGDGPLGPALVHQADAVGAPAVLLGARDDVPALLRAADVVVLPSHWEGQPLVMQEALHAGAAVVATDVGGTAAVAGDAALLVPPDSAPALATAIADVVTTPGRLSDLRHRARIRAGELPTQEQMIQQLVLRYRDLVR